MGTNNIFEKNYFEVIIPLDAGAIAILEKKCPEAVIDLNKAIASDSVKKAWCEMRCSFEFSTGNVYFDILTIKMYDEECCDAETVEQAIELDPETARYFKKKVIAFLAKNFSSMLKCEPFSISEITQHTKP